MNSHMVPKSMQLKYDAITYERPDQVIPNKVFAKKSEMIFSR